jgi:hypothetical protein
LGYPDNNHIIFGGKHVALAAAVDGRIVAFDSWSLELEDRVILHVLRIVPAVPCAPVKVDHDAVDEHVLQYCRKRQIAEPHG